MATLERKKKQIFKLEEDSDEDIEATTNDEHNDDLTNDPVLESLSKEPMEYVDECYLTQEVVESLQSLKNISLSVLDLLLLQMINDLPSIPRRSSCHDLLNSITQNTSLLQQHTPMMRSKSSPPVTNISDVYNVIRQSNDNHQDYTLSCTLAALLNDIYRLLELNHLHFQRELPVNTTNSMHLLQNQLHENIEQFQRQKAQGVMTIHNNATQEMLNIWNELDHLMNIISQLALQKQQSPPPAYVTEDPPTYDSVLHDTKKDLDHLLNAIDRLFCVAPRLNNQRATLSESQLKKLTAATLSKSIERLSEGRMENQRHELLHDLIHQIQKSASRSLDNQRVQLSTLQQKKMDFASIRHILDRLDKGRYTDQDWISHEEILIQDLTHTVDLLAKSLDKPAFNRQRFNMSETKERNLFMYGLFNKVESLEGYRLENQDAEIKSAEDDDDLQEILNYIYKSQLDNQRASFTL